MLALRSRRSFLALIAVATATLVAQPAGKRPITHRDYDGWRTISSQRLSDDGKFLAYALFPQDGDGEVVLKNLGTGEERREPAGARAPGGAAREEGEPAEPGPAPAAGPGGAAPRVISLSFTSDGRNLVFTTLPPKAEIEKARRERKPAPRGGLVILPTAGGDPMRIANVRGFQLAENNPQWLAYQEAAEAGPNRPADEAKEEQDEDQGRAPARAGAAAATRGSELKLRNLADATERKFADVSEYSLTKDGATLVYAVLSRSEETNGVYAAQTSGGEPTALASGKGRYQRIAWDDKQARAGFLTNRDGARYKVYLWKRGDSAAQPAAAEDTPGMRTGWAISERGALQFSKDGSRLFFATAPNRLQRPRAAAAQAAADVAVADLWHWKDENVQPMQKVRAEQDRNRSYRAVLHLAENRVTQLTDTTMAGLDLIEETGKAVGSDDRDYRSLVEFDERYGDYYSVDVATGARTLIARKQRGNLSPSPDGRFATTFDGRDWIALELATGKKTNLTGGIGTAFYNEDHDSPSTRNAYGAAGWTKDGKSVLLYDRYDIWQVSAENGEARNVTDGAGRKEKIRFRNVRMGEEDQPQGGRGPARGGIIDPAKPLLLSAENEDTRDTGFWEDRLGVTAPPVKLIMGAKSYSNPAKAKKADVLVFSATRFDEFGDLLVSDTRFGGVRKVSNANPQKEQLLWGTGELVRFKNTDGVQLTAALYKPENFDPKKKYPMMVYIYERLSQGVNRFVAPAPGHSINISYYVSNGYLVLTPDIVYTTGFPGQSASKCVLPAIQAVVDRGGVDERAIGIQGHSWGGYQIAYMVTQTNRFRAASAGAPVANMISAYDGIRWETGLPRQFQYERTQSRIGGSIWQYPTRFIENSPIFWADRVQTPLLMLHNDADGAVPWYQGIEFFLALRRLGKETYMFNYNGEPHGLRRRPNQKDYTMRLQQFFDHYLKGAPKPEWMERGIPFLEREQEKDKWRTAAESGPSGGAQ